MSEINIATGKKEITIRRDGEVAGSIFFSPADPALVARLEAIRADLAELDCAALHRAADAEDEASFFEELKKLDDVVREKIDYAFGYPVSTVVFGDSFAFSMTGGTSYAEQLIQGALAIIKDAMRDEQSAAQKRRDKYLSRLSER